MQKIKINPLTMRGEIPQLDGIGISTTICSVSAGKRESSKARRVTNLRYEYLVDCGEYKIKDLLFKQRSRQYEGKYEDRAEVY